MIYAALEHRIRQGLVEQNRSVADMKKKPTSNTDGPLDLCALVASMEYRLGEAPPQVTELTGDQQIIWRYWVSAVGKFIPKSGAECRLYNTVSVFYDRRLQGWSGNTVIE